MSSLTVAACSRSISLRWGPLATSCYIMLHSQYVPQFTGTPSVPHCMSIGYNEFFCDTTWGCIKLLFLTFAFDVGNALNYFSKLLGYHIFGSSWGRVIFSCCRLLYLWFWREQFIIFCFFCCLSIIGPASGWIFVGVTRFGADTYFQSLVDCFRLFAPTLYLT